MIAGAAVIALATGAGPEPVTAPAAAAAAAAAAEAKTAKLTQKHVTDHEGNKLTLDLDDTGKVVKAAATDRGGKPLEVVTIKMKDMKVCIPRGAKTKGTKPLWLSLEFVREE
jgi:hypothetical protein